MHDATIRDHNFNHGKMCPSWWEKGLQTPIGVATQQMGLLRAFTSKIVRHELVSNYFLEIELVAAPPAELYCY